MDDIVRQAIAKWPNVPHCYGWLGLDARGQWYLRDGATQALGGFDVARGKAIASVATGGVSGRELMERYKANPIVFGQISSLVYGGPMFPSQGSLPIFKDGVLIGAVGGSAASSQMDEDAGRAGIKAIGATETR